jgi:hypothetical protein
MRHADEARPIEENPMSIRQLLSDSAKHISKAEPGKVESTVRTQATLLGQFTVGLIACSDHDKSVSILQKAVSSMLAKGSIAKGFRRKLKDVPNQDEAIEDIGYHCHSLALEIEAAAEGDLMETLSPDVLKKERGLRIVVEALQAWLNVKIEDDWDTEADVHDAIEEAQSALAKLDGIQKHAMSVRDVTAG